MNISWSISITNAKMNPLELTVEDFVSIFDPTNVKEQPTKDGRNYIAGQLLDYSKPRGKGNIIDRSAVVLDCDDADTKGIEALCEAVKNLGVLSVVHSTYSSTPDKPRVRVVIPLATVVVPGDYVSLCKALMNHLNMVAWDESCAQAERAMYMPAKPEGGDYWAIRTDGPLMDGLEWLKAHTPEPKKRTSKGNVAKRDRKRKPQNDTGIQGAFNRVYTIEDAIEEFDLPYEPTHEGRWTYYGADSKGGLRLVEGREDLCISEHANTDPAFFIDGNGSHRALSAFELCAVHLYGEDDDTSLPPRDRASMQAMAKRAAEDEAVRAELGCGNNTTTTDVAWLVNSLDDVDVQAQHAGAALQNTLAYSEGLGWLVYHEDSGVWARASVSEGLHCVATVVRSWYMAAVLTGNEDFAKKASKLRMSGRLMSLLTHVEAFVTLPAAAFDADPALLCTPTGVVNLRTGKLMPHDPKYHMMQQTKAPYKPGATHETWTKALQALDKPEREWFQRWVGCGLTGYQPDDRGAALPILTGGGSNGKSVLMAGISRAFGGYAYMGSHALLLATSGKDVLHASAPLRGVRLCYIEEFPDGVLNSTALKQLSATPTVKGEYKFKTEFTFTATHSLMVSANVMPRLTEGTDGVIRRLTVLPFDYHYVPEPNPKRENEKVADPNLLRELENPEAQAAILAWAVEGAKAYFAAGQHVLSATSKMKERKTVWMNDVDVLVGFFSDMLIEDPDAMIPWTHLYAAFADWQRESGGKAWNKSTFKNRASVHYMFTDYKSGLLRTSGMSCYRDDFGNGPKAPTGGRVAGLRGLRFRTPADDIEEEAPVVIEPEAPVLIEAEAPALIAREDAPAPTPHVAPEREELERTQLAEECEALACELLALPSGKEELDRLVNETGCVDPQVSLGKLRAFKIRLEGALTRMYLEMSQNWRQ